MGIENINEQEIEKKVKARDVKTFENAAVRIYNTEFEKQMIPSFFFELPSFPR